MITKRILVLANSELLGDGSGETKWGSWIRPVSNHDEGALDFAERRLTDTKDSKPFDVVQMPLSAPENNPLQPENWLIQPDQAWTKESVLESRVLLGLVEQPESLWLDPSQKSDRASAFVLQRLPNFQSLYLIQPEEFHFQVRSRVWDGCAKKQQRGIFSHRGRHYDFALTDPLIGRKYFSDYPRTQEGNIQPADSSRILLCVSLTPPFHDLHYKVIATVFEFPA